MAAVGCEFHNSDLEVKMQIIMTANSTRVRQKGKSETISLADLLKFARAIEMESQNSKACYVDANAESVEFKQEKLNQMYKGNKYNQNSWEKKSGY